MLVKEDYILAQFKNITLKDINGSRWNSLLGRSKITKFTCIPGTGLSAIFEDDKLVAINYIYYREIDKTFYEGAWEVTPGI